jgi:hypothetical protein
VLDGVTGWLYKDPRLDNAVDFAAVLERILHGHLPTWGAAGISHLSAFSQAAFATRVHRMLESLAIPPQPATP